MFNSKINITYQYINYFQPNANKGSSGYSLHQLQGNKVHGFEKEGNLLKKSESRMKKIWQKRKCRIYSGVMTIGHSDVSYRHFRRVTF